MEAICGHVAERVHRYFLQEDASGNGVYLGYVSRAFTVSATAAMLRKGDPRE